MNNPNPFVPKGSLLEQQSKRRSRLKLGVFCVLAVGVAGLAAMLIQGCKREQTETENQPPVDTNNFATTETNPPTTEVSNPPVAPTPPPEVVTPAPIPPAPPEETEYVVVKGDTLGKIAKAHGVSLKTLEDANQNIQPTKLKIGQKLVIPASTGSTAAAETANGIATSTGNGEEIYAVKSGDTLTKIARANGTTVKAIETENNLSTTKIKVGQKLKIPAKAEAAPAPTTVNAPPAETASPAPETTNPAPAPSNPPTQQ